MVWLSRCTLPFSILPCLSLFHSSFHQIPRRDPACRCHYGSRRCGKVGAKLLNRRLRNQITDRDTTMPMHYLWPMPRASYTHTSVETQAGWTIGGGGGGLLGALIISFWRYGNDAKRLFSLSWNFYRFIRLNLNEDLTKFIFFFLKKLRG